jgi:ribose transport system ATP-binding protein
MGTESLPTPGPLPLGPTLGAAPCLEVSDLSKTYLHTRVLHDASLVVEPGQIHALLGANGSGKSTLVKCVTGVVAPDHGARIAIDGAAPSGGFSPTRAHRLGIRVVHQEAPLVDGLPVADSVALHRGYRLRRGIFTSSRRMRAEAKAVFDRLGVEIDPATPAGALSAAERAIVMLALALADVDRGARLVVLDEPTASLPANESEHFLTAVEEAAAQGVGVLLVTHRLAEVSERCDTVTVLRDGRVVASGPVAEFDERRMLAEIVGPEAAPADVPAGAPASGVSRFAPEPRDDGGSERRPVLEARGLAGELVSGVDLELAPGEILGVAGIVGSGAAEVGRLIAGVARLRAGSLRFDGEPAEGRYGIAAALRHRVAYVPGDRMREGGIAGLSVAANIALPALRENFRRPRQGRESLRAVIDTFKVRPPDPSQPFGTLSGGNQQKAIIGKWALTRPRLFVLDDPTAGVDPGAREDIYAVLRGLQQAGTAILLISSEPDQLVRLARRVIVVRAGRVVEELVGDAVTVTGISRAAM